MLTAIGVALGVFEVLFVFGMLYYGIYKLTWIIVESLASRLNQLLKSSSAKTKIGMEVEK